MVDLSFQAMCLKNVYIACLSILYIWKNIKQISHMVDKQAFNPFNRLRPCGIITNIFNLNYSDLNLFDNVLCLHLQQLLSLNGGFFISGNVSKKYLEKSGNVYIA